MATAPGAPGVPGPDLLPDASAAASAPGTAATARPATGDKLSKVLYMVTLNSKYARALTFETFYRRRRAIRHGTSTKCTAIRHSHA